MAREANKEVFSLYEQLNIGSNKILLLGFGGHSVEWELKDGYLPTGWVCLVLGAKPSDMPSDRFVAMDSNSYVPNLIYISDAVLGKLGFGFVSECIINNTPLIYVPRSGWPEESYLEEYICARSAHNALKMSVYDFIHGNWKAYLDAAVTYKQALVNKCASNNSCSSDNNLNIVPTDDALEWIGNQILTY